MSTPHIPILVDEWLQFLKDRPLETYLDGTLGAGGHAEAVLQAHPEIKRFIGIDQDTEALAIAKERLKLWQNKVEFVHSNFENISKILDEKGLKKVDAMLFDLGVSSMHIDTSERGFSFMQVGPLDMRMNQQSSLSAKEIVNHWSERELGRILRDYGEEREWRRVARVIVQARQVVPFETTRDLVEKLSPHLQYHKRRGLHPLTLVFQALRIAVNGELEVLEALLKKVIHHLAPGGILGIIAFHSLEDRLVKQHFRDEASDKQDTRGLAGLFLEKEPTIRILTRKPLIASKEEISRNPRSSSAKLRVVEKR